MFLDELKPFVWRKIQAVINNYTEVYSLNKRSEGSTGPDHATSLKTSTIKHTPITFVFFTTLI